MSVHVPKIILLLIFSIVGCALASGKDYYKTLGVDKTASDADIKKAYRKLALKYHPDRNKDAGAESKFADIGVAYETLIDPEKRKQYDEELLYGKGGPAPGGGSRNPHFNTEHFSSSYSTKGFTFGGGDFHFPGFGSFGGFGGPSPVPNPVLFEKDIFVTPHNFGNSKGKVKNSVKPRLIYFYNNKNDALRADAEVLSAFAKTYYGTIDVESVNCEDPKLAQKSICKTISHGQSAHYGLLKVYFHGEEFSIHSGFGNKTKKRSSLHSLEKKIRGFLSQFSLIREVSWPLSESTTRLCMPSRRSIKGTSIRSAGCILLVTSCGKFENVKKYYQHTPVAHKHYSIEERHERSLTVATESCESPLDFLVLAANSRGNETLHHKATDFGFTFLHASIKNEGDFKHILTDFSIESADTGAWVSSQPHQRSLNDVGRPFSKIPFLAAIHVPTTGPAGISNRPLLSERKYPIRDSDILLDEFDGKRFATYKNGNMDVSFYNTMDSFVKEETRLLAPALDKYDWNSHSTRGAVSEKHSRRSKLGDVDDSTYKPPKFMKSDEL